MEAVKEHVTQYYAYHGIEVTRSNTETCVVTLPPQFRDFSAFTADMWTEFGVVVDVAVIHGTIEATLRLDAGSKQSGATGLLSILVVVIAFLVAVVLGWTYIPHGHELMTRS